MDLKELTGGRNLDDAEAKCLILPAYPDFEVELHFQAEKDSWIRLA
jgi:hypothetical protein